VLSIGWNDSHKPWKIALQIVAGLCGLYSVYLSQTRGAWIAIPLFIFIAVSTLMHAQRTRIKAAVYIAIIVAIVALFSSTSIVHERVLEGTSDLSAFTDQKNLDTSVGVRLQLWNASWIMFKEHPLLGVGKENFSNELHVLHQRGIVTPMAAEQYHSHNEILYSMATMGVFGLLAILLTYFVPLFYFGKYMFHPDAQIHAAAAMGLSLCTGFIIFGTVDVMFGWNMCNVFYSCSIALFLAFIVTRAKEITV
jgi:O-antigen ligase